MLDSHALAWANAPHVGGSHPRVYSGNLPRVQHPFRPGRLHRGAHICRDCGMYRGAWAINQPVHL